jgi:hypothetical protein
MNPASEDYGTDQDHLPDEGLDELDELVLNEYPYPIAFNYKRLLEEKDWEKRTRTCVHVFECSLRTVTLCLVSQYLVCKEVNDSELNGLLHRNISRATLGIWNEIFFTTLRVYKDKRDLLFMPELYDIYWDVSTRPNQERKRVRDPFQRLVKIRNDVVHRPPTRDEDWRAISEESFSLLKQVLVHFTFLENYDLICVRRAEGNEYRYRIYTGCRIVSASQTSDFARELTESWFYLCRKERKLLELHPLLIFWKGEAVEDEQEKVGDAALFDRYRQSKVDYYATVLGRTVPVEDQALIAEFIHRVLDVIETSRERALLSWGALQQAAKQLTRQQMGTFREKYRRELYLQRTEVFRKFQEFLASDKSGFVLTGKSGVGKSNFVLSLVDEYADHEDVCLVIYNGARLGVSDTAEQTVSEGLTRYLKLKGKTAGSALAELNQLDDISGNKLVLIFDAINENPDGNSLLRHIDQMVGQESYPWLKIMITSRPNAWRTLRRELHLATEFYYHDPVNEEYWVELQGFTVRLEPFQRGELPEAYEKYRHAYNLQTKFEELDLAVRDAVRDPLILRLVAEIYQGQEIPKRVRVSDIYGRYVQALMETERLYQEDLILLEWELMPLMITENHYSNKLTASQLYTAETRDGRPLWELIYNRDLFSSGRRVNDSYTRLSDAEILTEQGPVTDYEIVFKYERFYDYFGGKRLRQLIKSGTNLEEFYTEKVLLTEKHPFLWGPVKTAIILELEDGAKDLAIQLSGTKEQSVKEMMTRVLFEFGQDEREQVSELLSQLIAEEEDRPPTWASYIGAVKKPPIESVNAKKIAIEVASELGIGSVLLKGVTARWPAVRGHAVQHCVYYWERNRDRGFDLLQALTRRIKPVHNVTALRNTVNILGSSLNISAYILFKNYLFLKDDAQLDQVKKLQSIWQPVIETLMYYDPQESQGARLKGLFKRPIRDFVLSRIIEFTLAIVESAPAYTSVNLREINAFFSLPREQKRRARRLLALVNPDLNTDIRSCEADLFEAAKDGDPMTSFIVEQGLVTHHFYRHENMVELARRLYDMGMEFTPPNIYAGAMMHTIYTLADNIGSEVDIQAYQCYRDMIAEYYDNVEGLFLQGHRGKYVPNNLRGYSILSYRLHRTPEVDLVEKYAARIRQQHDEHFARNFLYDVEGLVLDSRYRRVGFAALRRIIDFEEPIVEDELINLLTKVKVLYPESLELFFDEIAGDLQDPSHLRRFKRRVESKEVRESAGGVLSKYTIAMQREALQMPPLWKELQWTLDVACQCRSMAQWTKIIARELINIAYGAPIFRVEHVN